MQFLIFFSLYIITGCNKFVWDANQKDSTNIERELATLHKDEYLNIVGIVNNSSDRLSALLNLTENVTLSNVKILSLDISNLKPSLNGFRIRDRHNRYDNNQFFANKHGNEKYITKSGRSSCQLYHCEVGLYILHKNANENDILSDKIKEISDAFYIKLITLDMKFTFHNFTINGNKFPLVVCPYDKWVISRSGLAFEPYDRNGFFYPEFHGMHIILPAYPRDNHAEYFTCGDMVYADSTRLKIVYEFKKNNSNFMRIEDINLMHGDLICGAEHKPTDYLHFSYDEYNKSMKYINISALHNEFLYYGDIVYLYSIDDEELIKMKNGSEVFNFSFPKKEVEPLCAKKLIQLPATINLYIDDKLEKFSSPLRSSAVDIKIIRITTEMLNKDYKFDCKIDLKKIKDKKFISKYYDKVVKGIFVKYDKDGNKKFINKISFTENDFTTYGKYKCIPEIIRNQGTKDIIDLVKNITIIIVPKLDSKKEIWGNQYKVSIFCPKKLHRFANLEDFVIKPCKGNLCDLKKNKEFFDTNGDNVIFKHDKFFEKGFKIYNVTIKCSYKTIDGIKFDTRRDISVLEKVYESQNDKKKDKMDIKSILLCFAIVMFGLLFLAVTINGILFYFVRRKKKDKLDSLYPSISDSDSPLKGKPFKKVQLKTELEKPKKTESLILMDGKNIAPKNTAGKKLVESLFPDPSLMNSVSGTVVSTSVSVT
uniref:6-cysteine protein n=1 Tax=Parastrongyloides trichosuri TaxID=131310 RepID=A0A0N4Z657_PARTI